MNNPFLETDRLLLRRPTAADAEPMLAAYAADARVTRFLTWRTHANLDATREFLTFCEDEWARWPSGPLLVEDRRSGQLLGSTGLQFATPTRAATGYVLRHSAWGQGFAGELLEAMVAHARQAGLWRVEAICHVAHERSARVLERGGFAFEGRLARYAVFPNLGDEQPQDVLLFARLLRA